MTGIEKYEYWKILSDYDMQTAEVLIRAERWIYVATLAQQAVERACKGLYVGLMGKEAPKSHNVSFLLNKLTANPKFANSEIGVRFSEEKEEYQDDLIDIMFYYMSDYPFSYQKFNERFISCETALEIYEKAKKIIAWLDSYKPQFEPEL